jgi:hypothetical protein
VSTYRFVYFVWCTWKGRKVLSKTGKMTAHDQIRAMLDQLMGTGRNGECYLI